MMISEEALYAAAPEAAEKFLSALPDREDCVHDFSPDFEARMATLLRRQRRRRHWRALLAAAAVLPYRAMLAQDAARLSSPHPIPGGASAGGLCEAAAQSAAAQALYGRMRVLGEANAGSAAAQPRVSNTFLHSSSCSTRRYFSAWELAVDAVILARSASSRSSCFEIRASS